VDYLTANKYINSRCKCKLTKDKYTKIRGTVTNKKKIRSLVNKMMGEVKKMP
jgi:hypothetical protein